MSTTPSPYPDLCDEHWKELVEVTDTLCDMIEGVHPLIALAAIGNVACVLWQEHGDCFPPRVMRDWLNQVHQQTRRMHQPSTKH